MPDDEYCDLCDLPKSQCVHGRPPAEPVPTTRATPVRRSAPVRKPPSAAAPTRVVPRRWTPPEVFKPLILQVLDAAGGQLDADDAFLELEILAEDVLKEGDRERTPEGELRWQLAARKARISLLSEGHMVKAGPGVWKLA